MKTNNIAQIKINKNSCLNWWLKFTYPFHNMTDYEMKIVEFFLKKRLELITIVSDDTVLNEILLSKKTRDELKKEFNINDNRLNVILSALRKKNILKDNVINKRIIPNFSFDEDSFKFIVVFNFNE